MQHSSHEFKRGNRILHGFFEQEKRRENNEKKVLCILCKEDCKGIQGGVSTKQARGQVHQQQQEAKKPEEDF